MGERTPEIAKEYLEHYKRAKYGMMPEWVWDMAIKALKQEPCEDAISRKDVIANIKNLYPDMPIVNIMGARQKWLEKYAPYFECENAIERLPSVNPQEPKTGHWIFDDKCREHGHCSRCGYGSVDLVDGQPHNFCRNCGCRMVEPQESEEV